MTEEEAKTKRCCGPEGCGSGSGHCLGSACMAWRRQRFWWPAWTVGEVWVRKTAGYCGLADKP